MFECPGVKERGVGMYRFSKKIPPHFFYGYILQQGQA